jgi:hypothetical protein
MVHATCDIRMTIVTRVMLDAYQTWMITLGKSKHVSASNLSLLGRTQNYFMIITFPRGQSHNGRVGQRLSHTNIFNQLTAEEGT